MSDLKNVAYWIRLTIPHTPSCLAMMELLGLLM